MTRNAIPQQTLQQLPKKWAVAIVVALIAYVLLQPFANSRFGLGLPSLAGVLGMEKQEVESKNSHSTQTNSQLSKPEKSAPENSTHSNLESELDNASSDAEQEPKVTPSPAKSQEKEAAPKKTADEKSSTAKSPSNANVPSKTAEQKQAKPDAANDLLYGLLKDAGREVYVSPAGLRYTKGSEEGHRLKHIEKHLKDIPDRPGKHGVFDGDMAQVLRWIDDAYTRGKKGGKDVRKREEDGRTVYEVTFTKPIGYIGGRDGKRDRNPEAKRLRLVIEEDRVITAFPF